MISRITIVAIVLAVAVPAFAQGENSESRSGHRPPGHMRKKLLEKFDKDGDGKLSEDERKAARQEMLEKFDTNGDGEIDDSERQAIALHHAQKFIDKHDKDGDGKLSAEEIAAAHKERRKNHGGDRRGATK